jgi:hypothetical protein
MQNPFLKVNMDYVKVIEALMLNANQAYERNKDFSGEGGQLIREFRTIGIKAARQTGLTSAMRQWVTNHPNETLCVFKDPNMAKFMKASFIASTPGSTELDVPFKTTTAYDLREVFEGRTEFVLDITFIEDCRYIFVDDADVVLNRCGFKPRTFNDWVYQTFGSQVLVIHLG